MATNTDSAKVTPPRTTRPVAPVAPSVSERPRDKLLKNIFSQPDSRQAREDEVSRVGRLLRQSGASSAAWTLDATRAIADLRDRLEHGVVQATTWRPIECFEGGCAVEIEFAEKPAFHQLEMILENDVPLHEWPGGIIRTAPREDEGGRLAQLVILVSPDRQ